jgi:hypothetical protein
MPQRNSEVRNFVLSSASLVDFENRAKRRSVLTFCSPDAETVTTGFAYHGPLSGKPSPISTRRRLFMPPSVRDLSLRKWNDGADVQAIWPTLESTVLTKARASSPAISASSATSATCSRVMSGSRAASLASVIAAALREARDVVAPEFPPCRCLGAWWRSTVAVAARSQNDGRSSKPGSEAQICFGVSTRWSGAMSVRVAAKGPAALTRLS